MLCVVELLGNKNKLKSLKVAKSNNEKLEDVGKDDGHGIGLEADKDDGEGEGEE